MQKQANLQYGIEMNPIDIPEDFPIAGGGTTFLQEDKEILYLHLHQCLEIGYCHSGSGIFVVEDKILSFNTGDVSVVNHLEMHRAQSVKGHKSLWTFLFFDPVKLLKFMPENEDILNISRLGGPGFSNIFNPKDNPEIHKLTSMLVQELTDKKANYKSVARGLVWSLMAQLSRIPGRSEGKVQTPDKEAHRIAPAIQYMADHYNTDMTISDLAGTTGMSSAHFRRIFKSKTGLSPLTYLNQLRIKIAVNLLKNTSGSILSIANETGFSSISSFNRTFKVVMKKSPREVRKS